MADDRKAALDTPANTNAYAIKKLQEDVEKNKQEEYEEFIKKLLAKLAGNSSVSRTEGSSAELTGAEYDQARKACNQANAVAADEYKAKMGDIDKVYQAAGETYSKKIQELQNERAGAHDQLNKDFAEGKISRDELDAGRKDIDDQYNQSKDQARDECDKCYEQCNNDRDKAYGAYNDRCNANEKQMEPLTAQWDKQREPSEPEIDNKSSPGL